jgi:hypothetical protein
MFYDRNHLFIGLLIGICMPIIAYATILLLAETWDTYGPLVQVKLSEAIKPRTLALVALCINVFIMRWYQRRRYEDSMRGVFIAVGIGAIAWIVRYGVEIFA